MLKTLVALALGAAILLASAVWAGTVIDAKLVRLETISGPDIGAYRLVP